MVGVAVVFAIVAIWFIVMIIVTIRRDRHYDRMMERRERQRQIEAYEKRDHYEQRNSFTHGGEVKYDRRVNGQ